MNIINYYSLLGCDTNASTDEIKLAYDKKIKYITYERVSDYENYQTAYYILSNPERRLNYDKQIGVTPSRHISFFTKLCMHLIRLILTILDCLAELYWSIIIVLNILTILYYILHKYNAINIQKYIDISLSNIQLLLIIVVIILSGIIITLIHPRIRKYNRILKLYLSK